jgi:hypothetical protein
MSLQYVTIRVLGLTEFRLLCSDTTDGRPISCVIVSLSKIRLQPHGLRKGFSVYFYVGDLEHLRTYVSISITSTTTEFLALSILLPSDLDHETARMSLRYSSSITLEPVFTYCLDFPRQDIFLPLSHKIVFTQHNNLKICQDFASESHPVHLPLM